MSERGPPRPLPLTLPTPPGYSCPSSSPQVEPDTVGARAGLAAGDVVLAVNGISGQTNYQVVEMIRTLHGELTFLVAPAPKQAPRPQE